MNGLKGLKIAMVLMLSLLLIVAVILFAVAQRMPDPLTLGAKTPADELRGATPHAAHWPAATDADDVALQALSNTKIGWGMGTSRNDRNQPVDCITAQEKYGALGAQFIFPDDEKIIYLTFDLGYENGYTEPILDALDAWGAKGTFFITLDYAKQAPEILERIIRDGHTLANHTNKHPCMPAVSEERQRAEIMELHDYVYQQYGYSMTLFRYPKGEFSEQSLALVSDLGYKSIFWSYAYVDWKTDAQPSLETGMNKLLGALHDGAIYMLHTVSSTNAAIMDDFLEQATAQGYSFELIDQRIGLAPSSTQHSTDILSGDTAA